LHVPTITLSDNSIGSWIVLSIVPFMKKKLQKRDFGALFSSWMLCHIHWYLVIDVLEQSIGSTFKVQAVLGFQSKKCLTLTTSTTNQCCLTSQKGDNLIYTTAEAWGRWLLRIYHVPSTICIGSVFPVYQLLVPNKNIKFTLFSFDVINFSKYMYIYIYIYIYFNIHFWNLSLFQ